MADRIECQHCGELIPKTAKVCHHCKGSARYDVVLAKPIPDDRTAYQTARKLASSGIVELEFLDIKRRIEAAPGALVEGLTAEQAEELVFLMVSNGVLVAEIRPHEGSEPRPLAAGSGLRFRSSWLWIAAAVVAAATTAVLVAVRGGGSDEGEVVTAQTIAERVVGSTVRLKADNRLGTGFFVTDDLVVTNAHVVASQRAPVEVTFESGLRAGGRAVESDEWHDIAIVRVTGAGATPLPVADSSNLERGEPVFFVGSPRGLDFTFSRGIVSHPARTIRGVSYIQVDAAINPGNSGGPLLNGRGEVVGLVTMVVGEGSNLGLAVPINYLLEEKALDEFPGIPLLDTPSWTAVLDAASRQNRIDVEEFQAHEGRIEILAAGLGEHDAVRVIVTQWARETPGAVGLEFRLENGETTLCRPTGTIELWSGNVTRRDLEELDPRLVMWLERNRLMHTLYLGQTILDMRGCPGPLEVMRSTLRLKSFDGFVSEKPLGGL